MYEESIQRPDRDPFEAYTSSRAKQQGRAKKEEIRRRGNEGTIARGVAPYLAQDVMVRRDGWSGEDDALEGYERDLRPNLDFEKVSTVPTDVRELAESLTLRRSLDDKYEDQPAPCSGVSRGPLGFFAEEEEMTDSNSSFAPSSLRPSLQTQSQSASSSLEKRVDFWQPRPSQRTRRTRQGLILLALSGVGGLTTWGVLRTRKREAERKRKKQEEEAAAAEAAKTKGHAPAPSPAGAPAPAPALKP